MAMPLGNEAVPVHTRRDPVRPFGPQDFLLNDVSHFSVNSVLTIALYDALFMFFGNLDSLRSGKKRCSQPCSFSASSEYRSQCTTARDAAGGEHVRRHRYCPRLWLESCFNERAYLYSLMLHL